MATPNAQRSEGEQEEVEVTVETPEGRQITRRTMIGGTIAAGVAALLSGLTPKVPAQERRDAKTNGERKVKAEYTEEEKQEWLSKLHKMNDKEFEDHKMSPEGLGAARMSRDAERFGIDKRYEKVFPDELGESDWTKNGKLESNTGTQVFVFKVRVKTRDGKVVQSKKFYLLGFSKLAIHGKNPFGVARSQELDTEMRISTTAADELCKRDGYGGSQQLQKGQLTLEEVVNGKAAKVAMREKQK